MAIRHNQDGKVTFVCTPEEDAKSVYLAGDFNQWNPQARRMVRRPDGSFRARMQLPPGEHEYKFVVDGKWCCDPDCRKLRENALGSTNSVVKL